MGFLLAAGASISSVLGDMGNDILVRKGEHHTGKSGLLNRGGADNIITSGSTIVVNEGQCAIIVDQGAIVDVCAEPGAFTYEAGSPSIFAGSLGESIKESFNRFKYGGVAPRDQRIYYFNIKDIIGNKYGTASPVPFRVVDRNIGLDVDITIKCFGEYSFRLADPILFYKNICGNVSSVYTKDQIASQLKSELLTQLQPAFAQISEMGIRYSALPGHADDLARILNDLLSDSWGKTYGIQIVTFGVNSVKAPEEDEKMIKELQKTAVCPGYAGCGQEPERRHDGLCRPQHGSGRRRHGNGWPLQRGSPAAGSPAGSSSAGGSPDGARRLLDLPQLRNHRPDRQVLRRVRHTQTGSRPLDLPYLRNRRPGRQVLPQLRDQEALSEALFRQEGLKSIKF